MNEKEYGFIYKITCIPTHKSYIGQVKEFKYKNNKPYNYGVEGRWNDHVSSSKKSNTVFANAIKTYGKDMFVRTILEEAPLHELDALEAHYIDKENTVTPNGYNTTRHSQVKNRTSTNIDTYFQDKVNKAVLKPIRNKGVYKLVYVMLHMNDNTTRRIVFGQDSSDTYETSYASALEFINKLDCEYEEDKTNSDNLEERYHKKIEELKNKEITHIRMTKMNEGVALYISTTETTNYKEQKRICFSSKTKPFEEIYNTALEFINCIPINDKTIIETHIL